MKELSRFVLDTNVVISAFLFPESEPGRTLHKVTRSGKAVVSIDTIAELTETFGRAKFEKYLPETVRRNLIRKYENDALVFAVFEKTTICRDPKDDKFLSLALAAKATAIISGDDDLLVLNPFGSIIILSPSDFLKKFH